MQPLLKLYVKLTNNKLHGTHVAKCCKNLHAVTLLQYRGIKESIRKCHHINFSTEVDDTMPKNKFYELQSTI